MYGAKIAQIRLARGYSQEYMAKQLDIRQNEYSRIESNQRDKIEETLLEQIAQTLGVNTEDIKSPTPIVMSFHDSSHNAPFGTQNNTVINEKIIDELRNQLQTKDAQIAQLLNLINTQKA